MAKITIRRHEELFDYPGEMAKCLICSEEFYLAPDAVIELHREDGKVCNICYSCMSEKLSDILFYLHDYDGDIKEIRDYFSITPVNIHQEKKRLRHIIAESLT